MTSWVDIFSKFTPEALLFESLMISVLCASYAAFWVLRKRRLGTMTEAVPVGVVRGYLNELIVDAERLRAQLFGLLAGADAPALSSGGSPLNIQINPGTPGLLDAEAAKKLKLLEAQMADQNAAMQNIVLEKTRLEKELAEAKATDAKTRVAGDGNNGAVVAELEKKIKLLEGKLAEYSVIEDDLANLKRLQQENAQLKAQLAGKAGAATAAPEPETAPPSITTTEPALVAPATTPAEPEPVIAAQEAPAEPAIQAPLGDIPGADALFAGLVDQVEKSLEPEVANAAPAQPSTSAQTAGTVEKSDADLVAEFEKMLNG